jgi:prepilin-type N-terminal cleavage/methylation domain-containing protein
MLKVLPISTLSQIFISGRQKGKPIMRANIHLYSIPSPRVRDMRGFSLIELLVVVAVLAILAAIAIPLFLNQKNKAYSAVLRTETRQVVAEMETYRTTLPPDTNLDVSKVAADLAASGIRTNPANQIYVVLNCSSDGTTVSRTDGYYMVRALYRPPNGQGGIIGDWFIYDSKLNQWFTGANWVGAPAIAGNLTTALNAGGVCQNSAVGAPTS